MSPAAPRGDGHNKRKVLVVEDEKDIRDLIRYNLEQDGFVVLEADEGELALALVKRERPALVILDIMLPGMSGLDICRAIRHDDETTAVPILMLTARAAEVDKVVGLEMGADDYVTKPFSPRELVARIKAALRRLQTVAGPGSESAPLDFAKLRIDTAGRRVTVSGAPVELTAIEFDLLKALAENRGRVLTREQLLEKVWGYDYFGDTRVVDVHLGHVRRKLGDESLISTVRGVGYRFEDESP